MRRLSDSERKHSDAYTAGIRTAYRRGKDAYNEGLPVSSNPYRHGSYRLSFEAGYKDQNNKEGCHVPETHEQ